MPSTQKPDYKDTINLPRTAFPMQAKLPQREPERLARWQQMDLSAAILRRRDGAPNFCLHDGPPYANGDIHMGHALNKILKDLLVRYKAMSGHYAYYVPGWDCHGLPIEQKVMTRLGSKAYEMPAIDIRRQCHAYAEEWVETQREQFKRLGIGGDWEHPYLTIQPQVESGILRAFRELVARGLVRKGFRPVYWDPVFRTALAEAEIEYEEHTSESIYVKFPLHGAADVPGLEGLDRVAVVIWTTTPWTLPANLGVCLHPQFAYVVLAVAGEHLIVARELAEAFCAACGLGAPEVVATVRATDLERRTCAHPIFADKTSLIMLGEHVTLEQGTGCVHTAPGHGVDDFLIGRQYGLPVFVPVDDAGRFTSEYPEMQGENVFKANAAIVEKLREAGLLLGHGQVRHQYPYSWRSHKPIIFRATEQWFMELDKGGVREAALRAIDEDVQWIPGWGHDRIRNMVADRPDWCLSRQRSWGVPIPSFRSRTERKSILNLDVIDKVIELSAERGTDVWFTEPLATFWPDGWVYEPTGESDPEQFEKEAEVLDVWFDSGATSLAVCEPREGLTFPAAMYLEGSDQHRGWFQSSLLVGIGTRGVPPYRAVLTHGFVLDEKGEAMSKSKGNVISPMNIVKDMGADGLRLWVISEDYRADMRISKDKLKQTGEAYRRLRNTFRFLLGNLYDFDVARDAVAPEAMEPIDRWVLARLQEIVTQVTRAYESCEFHRIFHLMHTFCAVQLSALYLDVIKDRLYCSAPDDHVRRSSQTACRILLDTLVRAIAPILVFTADEVWEHAGFDKGEDGLASVHLADFPVPRTDLSTPGLDADWERLLSLRGVVSRRLEEMRRAREIGHSLDAGVELTPTSEEQRRFLANNIALLCNLFIVSQVRVADGLAEDNSDTEWVVSVHRAAGSKCDRCWVIDPKVGDDGTHPGLCPRCVDVVGRIA